MSQIWEDAIQQWYEKSHASNLEYLDLASNPEVSLHHLAHNLAILYDRTCLSSCVHLKHFKTILERVCDLKKEVSELRLALTNLTTTFLESRSLTKQEVKELVAGLSKQPRLSEREALRLTEELNKRLERVEKLLHQIERWTAA